MTDPRFPCVLLPRESFDRITSAPGRWGVLDYRYDQFEGVLVITGSSDRDKVRYGTDAPAWSSNHYLTTEPVRAAGFWYRIDLEGLVLHQYMAARQLTTTPDALKERVAGSWHALGKHAKTLILTWTTIPGALVAEAGDDIPNDDASSDEASTGEIPQDRPVFVAWWADHETVEPADLEVVMNHPDFDVVRDQWPVDDLAVAHALVIGCGSIGGTIATGLARSGIGHLTLIDPDRMLERNIVRHELSRRHLGRHKITGLVDELQARHPDLEIDAYALNAVTQADSLRGLLGHDTNLVNVVVGATDGVESRRVINHLARRAGIPAVFACVLEDGAFGEVVRTKPGTGCLLCLRKKLRGAGALDPEPGIDLGYGTGTRHRPMTAAPTDLRFVADLATKVVVATLLEATGHADQRLAGDHAVVGLRPVPDRPPPFDIERCGELRWSAIGPPDPECVTCRDPAS